MKRFVGFAGRVTVVHVVTYIALGALAYPLLTREFFEEQVLAPGPPPWPSRPHSAT